MDGTISIEEILLIVSLIALLVHPMFFCNSNWDDFDEENSQKIKKIKSKKEQL